MTVNLRPMQVGFHPPGANSGGAGVTPGGFDATMTTTEFKQWLIQTLASCDPTLYSDTTQYTEAVSTAVDISSYTIPGGMLSQAGEGIDFYFAGITAATANNKTALVTFGGTTILTTGALAANNVPWELKGRIMRVSAAVQEIVCSGNANAAAVTLTRTAGAIDLTVDQLLKLNVTSAVATAGLTQTLAVIKKFSQFNTSIGA